MTSDIATLLMQHRYLALVAVVIGLIVRLLKSDTVLPITVPSKWRPWIAVALGIVGGVVEHVSNGTSWREAIVLGLIAGALPIVGHDLFIEGLRGGKELPMPQKATSKDG